MLVLVCVLAHVVQVVLVALDVLAVLLLAQAIALAHALDAMVALDVVLVVQVDARVGAHILAVLNVLDVADVQVAVGKAVLLHVPQVAVLVRGVQIHVTEGAKVNVLQLAEDVNLALERVPLVVKVDVLVVLDVIVAVCIRVPVDALLVAINVVQHVGAVAMVVLDVQDVLIRVMANAADVLAAVKADVIVTVLLLALDATDALILVRDVVVIVTLVVVEYALDVKAHALDAQVHVQVIVVHHVKLLALDVLAVLAAVQRLVLDVADVQEIALADARVAQRIVALDALAAVQRDAAIAARQAALLPVTPIVQEHVMARAPTRMCHLLNRLTV